MVDEGRSQLTDLRCTACRKGEPTLTDAEIAAVRTQIPGWEVIEVDGINRLRRVFTFPDFAQALGFTDLVGRLAEEEGHHPALLTEWGRTTVTWWTHKIGGLHRNDLIMAARTARLFGHQVILGHSSIVLTSNTYGHVLEHRQRQVAVGLDAVLGG